MGSAIRTHLTGSSGVAPGSTTGRGGVVTQGDTSLVAPTERSGVVPLRGHWTSPESALPGAFRDQQPSWQERMGLTVAEALGLPALAGTAVAAGASGLTRVVRHMVVD